MKISLENTKEEKRRVEVQTEFDDLTISQVWEDLIKPALLAYGFAEQSVDSLLKGEKYE